MGYHNLSIRKMDGKGRCCRRAVLALLLILLTGGLPPAQLYAQEESLEWRLEHLAGAKIDEVRAVFNEMKSSVARDDRKSLCRLANYPLRTSAGRIGQESLCRARHRTIFNDRVVSAIRAQKFEELFVNWQGIMIGDGEVWLAVVCHDSACRRKRLGIMTVNNR